MEYEVKCRHPIFFIHYSEKTPPFSKGYGRIQQLIIELELQDKLSFDYGSSGFYVSGDEEYIVAFKLRWI